MPKLFQPSFGAGELTPGMAGRVDMAKYRAGLKTLKNFYVHPNGGVSNRPGTRYIGTALGAGRLIPFRFNVTQTYILELTDYKLRIIANDGYLTSTGTIIEVESPFAAADLAAVNYCQSADTLFLVHPSYKPVKLVRNSATDWEFIELTFVINAQAPSAPTATKQDGKGSPDATRSLKYQVSAVMDNGEESLPSEATSVTVDNPWTAAMTVAVSWSVVPGATAYRVYKNSRGAYGLVLVAVKDTARIPNGTALSSGDNVSYPKANAFDRDVTTTWRSAASVVAGTTYLGQDFGSAKTVRGVILRQGTDSGRCVDSVKLQHSADGTTWTDLQTFSPTKKKNLRETFTVTATPVAKRYWRLLSNDTNSSAWEIAELEFREEGIPTEFLDDNVDPDTSLSPRNLKNPFDGPGNYPGAVAIYEQRLVFARTNNNPQTVWMTRTGVFNDLSESLNGVQPDDGIELTLDSRQINEIRHLVPLDGLITLTAGAEWTVSRGGNTDAIAPNSLMARVQGYRGCSSLAPLVIGRSVFFSQRAGSTVREMSFAMESDGLQTADVSVLAGHLFRGRSIVSWAYQQEPDSIIWAVRDDGVALGLTYLKEHEVWAWHRHTTDGLFKGVAVIEGSGQDDVYFLVKRTVDDEEVYYVEKLTHRLPDNVVVDGVFLDSSLTYDSTPATTISGLGHLEGCIVTALADGVVIPSLRVAAGVIELPSAASVVHVGLPYTSDLETLPLEYDQEGTAQGRKKRVPRLTVRLQDSKLPYAGADFVKMFPVPASAAEFANATADLFTGDLPVLIRPTWDLYGRICLQMRDPLPLTVLAVVPEVDNGQ